MKVKNILGNFTSVMKVNSSDFLVTADEISNQQHIRVTNDSFFRKKEPFPVFEFADFRKNEFYIKVFAAGIHLIGLLKEMQFMFQFYVMWLHLFFNILLPLAVLAFLNRAIYRKLRQVDMIPRLMIRTFTLQVPDRLSAVSHGSTDNLNPHNVSEY